MTYLARDASSQDGAPVHLFQFVQGAVTWRYTTAASPVAAFGETWAPASITGGAITQSNDVARDVLSLKFPIAHELAQVFLGFLPDVVTSVTIFRGHLSDPDAQFITYWKGRVSSYKASGGGLSLECEPIFTSMRRPGLRARYQKSCRHALYGRGCNLDPEAFVATGRCTFMNGVTMIVPEAALLPVGWLTGGMVRLPDASLRYVVNHVGSQLDLIRTADSLALIMANSGYGRNYGNFYGGVAVKLYPGCDHGSGTCLSKFANLDNYGGFPWIPSKNPMGGSSII